MSRIITSLTAFFCLTIIVSCSSPTNTKDVDNSSFSTTKVEQPSNTIFGINGEDIVIRTTPGEKSKKLINEKATQSLGETHYCQVDYSTKVEVLESKGNWSKIKVVEPEWLSETHLGWIPSKYLIGKEDEEKQSLGKLDPKEYEIIKTEDKPAVQKFHVLLKHTNFDKNYVYQFVKQFRKENCTMNCNVYVYDNKSILPLVDVYPLKEKDYIKLADHFVSMSTFDATEVRDWYPYQDFKYKEYGGKNWKKEPIK
ncbi:MAG: hypothetical protein JWQ96_2317 [Segetibacter sp.]|nr:hypothetical protein [Segetibacter sp.]